jgi:hypothetical protein
LGQVSEYSSETPRNERWGVFHEHESRFHLANDASVLSPEAGALATDPGALSGAANVLTRKSAGDDVDVPAPGAPVEGAHVVPHGEPRQGSVALSGEQHPPAVGINLDSADGMEPEKAGSQETSSGAGEEGELSHCSSR